MPEVDRSKSTSGNKHLFMIGTFPPPMHGMAAVNAAVRDVLRQAGTEPQVIDLAAPSLDRSLRARLGRLPRVLRGLVHLAGTRGLGGRKLYMSVSGGLGQVYELLFLMLVRIRGMRVFLHHHSFAYLDTPSRLTQWLVQFAGSDAVHITLSSKMAERLKNVYGPAHVAPISNAVFFVSTKRGAPPVRDRLKTIGFLSNISAQKGVFDFLNLCEVMRDNGLPLRALLGGPFQDGETERQVRERLMLLPNVEYVGPKYNVEKDSFFSGIDAIVFPTRYVNEAEPVTLHEAMSRGISVVAYGRGCIPEIVGPNCGLVIDPQAPFVPAALAQIKAWLDDSEAFEAASRAAAQRFAETYSENERRWQVLLNDLTQGDIQTTSGPVEREES